MSHVPTLASALRSGDRVRVNIAPSASDAPTYVDGVVDMVGVMGGDVAIGWRYDVAGRSCHVVTGDLLVTVVAA